VGGYYNFFFFLKEKPF